jgi:hypothetical protein
MKLLFGLLPILQFALQVQAESAPPCSDPNQELLNSSVTASAGVLANSLKRSGSVRRETQNIFEQTESKLKETSVCAERCPGKFIRTLSFNSVPNKSLSDYSDYDHCQQKLENTSESALVYSKDLDASFDELQTWISDFSQGKNQLGKELYKVCDKSCSPAPLYKIVLEKESFTVQAEVVCGHARDKGDNQYQLFYKLTTQCEKT